MFKYFSMFSGISGFEKGIEQAYGNHSSQFTAANGRSGEGRNGTFEPGRQYGVLSGHGQRTGNPICIGYSEINKQAIQIYRKHYPNHKNYGNATAIIPESLPDFDLLVGGFPCQAFSIAGKRGGFADTRGTLFFEIARILRTKKPRNFLLENVKGLFSHDSGNTFKTIIETLNDIGYCVEWDCLNSKFYGVPQNRERVFIVGYFGGLPEREIFPLGDGNETAFSQSAERNISGTISTKNQSGQCSFDGSTTLIGTDIVYALDSGYAKGSNDLTKHRRTVNDSSARKGLTELNQIGYINTNATANRIYDSQGLAATLKGLGGGGGAKTGLYAVDTKNIGEARFTENVASLGANDYKEPKSVFDGSKIRRLTPLECERLQSFPDFWTQYGIDETGKEILMSDSARYRCLGNAVTVNVIEAIISKMIKAGRFDA